jgi:hypothetical protein
MSKQQIKWLDEPQAHDYPAALSYLSLLLKPQAAKAVVKKLKEAKMTQFQAKDILRASGLTLLNVSNSHVEADSARILNKEGLSPLLLCRDKRNGRLVIADGYHRLCAAYKFDEDATVPCKIV